MNEKRYLLEMMLFSDVISFDPRIFHKLRIISADISGKVEKSLAFFSSQLTCERRSLFQDMT